MRNSMVIWLLQIPEKIRVSPLMETFFFFFFSFLYFILQFCTSNNYTGSITALIIISGFFFIYLTI